jgi:hypothetical protein
MMACAQTPLNRFDPYKAYHLGAHSFASAGAHVGAEGVQAFHPSF